MIIIFAPSINVHLKKGQIDAKNDHFKTLHIRTCQQRTAKVIVWNVNKGCQRIMCKKQFIAVNKNPPGLRRRCHHRCHCCVHSVVLQHVCYQTPCRHYRADPR
jgi:hypothetical protein